MLTYFVITSILMAVFIFITHSAKIGKIVVLAVQLGLVVAAFFLVVAAREQTIITVVGGYEGVLGVLLVADSVSAAFVFLTAVMFFVVALYALQDAGNVVYWFLLLIWQGLMAGVFLANDFFNIFVLMEVATVVVTSLIMYDREKRSMYDGLFYLMINIVAAQFYLFGVGYLYRQTGVLDIDAATIAMGGLDRGQLILPYALIMTFISLKCALVPLYAWLPRAYAASGAPPSVLAILSGLHIKSSIFLFIRFSGAFAEHIDAAAFFMVIGIVTAIVGIVMAWAQTDMYYILAYSSVAQMGLIITGFSIGGHYNVMGSWYHMINHAVLKSALFLSAGVIASAYGTRNIHEIRGVFKRMPLTAAMTILFILGMAGAPLFNASISKYWMMHGVGGVLYGILVFINLGTIVMFIKYSTIFFGKANGEILNIAANKQAIFVIMGALCVLGGVFGRQFIYFLFNTVAMIDTSGYIEKAAIFAGSLVAGYFIFKYCVKNNTTLEKVGKLQLGFRGACASMGMFFAVVLVIVNAL